MRFSRLTVATLSLALSAACGSTVQMQSSSSTSLGSDTTGLTQGTTGGATTGASAGLPGGSATGTTSGTTGGTVTVPGTTGTTVSGDLTPVRGTDTIRSIKIGVIYLKGLDQAYAAAGASSATSDSRVTYGAVFRYLNARGGAGGVKLDPSYYAVDASSTQSQATQVEAACANFTGDHPVDIVLSYTRGSGGSLAQCLEKHRIPLINGFSEAGSNAATFTTHQMYWEPSQLTLDALGVLLANHLLSNHYADTRWPSAANCAAVKDPRIGVLTLDRPEWRDAYNRGLAPAFKAKGHPVYDTVFVAVSGSTAEQVSQAASGAQSAVLKFASECIDHVLFMSNVALDYLFMDIAEKQSYRPRYGLSSLEAPPVIVPNLANAANPTNQLHGAMGPGWSPYSDVLIRDFDSTAKAPSALCLTMLTAANAVPTDNNAAILALPSCEGPLFASAVVATWAKSPPGTTMTQVVNALGSTYHPVGAYTAAFGPSQHAGATSYRTLSYVDACSCFRYSSGLRAI
jgi:hypothetical protein